VKKSTNSFYLDGPASSSTFPEFKFKFKN
jgi:hypothetical protein